MAINNQDQLLAGMRPPVGIQKASQAAEGAGTWHSLWKAVGYPVAGVNPPLLGAGSGYTPTNTTAGALPFVNPSGGQNTHLARLAAAGGTVGTLIIYDRLWACSGFNTTLLTAQNVTTPGDIPARDANGAALGNGVELWLEVYTAPGATGATWTVSYTNQAGTSGRSATYTHPANAESVGQMMPMNFAAGDSGVRSVASLTCSVSSGTAGDVGITLVRRVAELPIMLANVASAMDALALGMPRIYDSSCLAMMVLCSATNTGLIQGSAVVSQG
jgi:hypothetical protein